MILLFGEKASNKMASKHSSNIKSHPVENSGILAMNSGMTLMQAKSILSIGEYDEFVSSNPIAINYAAAAIASQYYGNDGDSPGFLSNYSDALAGMSDSGFADGGFAGGGECACASSCGSFSSVC